MDRQVVETEKLAERRWQSHARPEIIRNLALHSIPEYPKRRAQLLWLKGRKGQVVPVVDNHVGVLGLSLEKPPIVGKETRHGLA